MSADRHVTREEVERALKNADEAAIELSWYSDVWLRTFIASLNDKEGSS